MSKSFKDYRRKNEDEAPRDSWMVQRNADRELTRQLSRLARADDSALHDTRNPNVLRQKKGW